jgi:CheY-like chemotaxis protein
MRDSKLILVIDDDEDIRNTIKSVLETESYRVLTAENGKDGLDKLMALGEQLPRLILVDLMMPIMDGLQFLQTVESQHKETIGKIPIVLATAKGSVKALPEHPLMAEHLRKPMDIDVLFKIAEKYCAKADF